LRATLPWLACGIGATKIEKESFALVARVAQRKARKEVEMLAVLNDFFLTSLPSEGLCGRLFLSLKTKALTISFFGL